MAEQSNSDFVPPFYLSVCTVTSSRRMSTFPRRAAFPAHRTRPPVTNASFASPSHGRSSGSQYTSIPDLREAINSLDSRMASLMHERHALETHLERAVRLQAPVHRIPSELLSHIFIIGVLDATDDNPVMVPTLMLVW